MIPKIIHYIWLGEKKKPQSLDLAFKSWQKYALGFKIKEWSEHDIDEFNLPPIFFELLSKKQFAFASDVLRFYILKKYGGVYMDVDQILVSSIDDLLHKEMFISKYHEVDDYYGFGLIGMIPEHRFAIAMCNFYTDNTLKTFVVVNKIGSQIINSDMSNISILDQEYFYPLSPKDFTFNTRSYHMANTSWIPWYKKLLYKIPGYIFIKNITKKILPNFIKNKIFKIDYL